MTLFYSSVEVSSQRAEVVAASATTAPAAAAIAFSPATSSITVVHGSLVQFKVFTQQQQHSFNGLFTQPIGNVFTSIFCILQKSGSPHNVELNYVI